MAKNKHIKISLIICAVISLLVISSGLALSGELTDESFYWEGQEATISEGVNADEIYQLYETSGDNDDFKRQYRANNQGELIIDTSDYGNGTFSIEDSSANVVHTYDVYEHTLRMEMNETTVLDDEDVEFEVRSSRAEFNMVINGTDTDVEDLENAFDISNERLDVNEDDYLTISDVEDREKIVVDTGELPDGTIELMWMSNDTNAQNMTFLHTSTDIEASADFTSDDGYENNLGDKVNISMELVETDEADIQIGLETYSHNFTVADANDNNKVHFEFDSSIAGNGSQPVEAGDGTSIVSQEFDTDVSSDLLATTTYTIESEVRDIKTDINTLTLSEPEYNEIDVYKISNFENINMNTVPEKGIETAEVSERDYIMYEIGIGGYHSMLEDIEPSDLDENSSFSDESGLSFEIIETSSGPNVAPDTVNLSDAKFIDNNGENNTIHIVFDASDYPNLELDSEDESEIQELNAFEAELSVNDNSPHLDEDESISIKSDVHSIAEDRIIPTNNRADARFGDGPYIVEKDDGIIQAKTALADGQNISIVATGLDAEFASLEENEITDGELDYKIDTDEIGIGDEFTLSIPTTDEQYEFIVGTTSVIEETDIPSEVTAREEFNFSVDIQEDIDNDLEYTWNINGNEYEGMENSTSLDDIGEFDIELMVENDDLSIVDSRNISVDVMAEYDNPDVSISTMPNRILFTGTTFELTASESNIGNDDIVEYTWYINDIQQINDGAVLTNQFDESGTHNVTVEASTEDGLVDEENIELIVYESQEPVERIYDSIYERATE